MLQLLQRWDIQFWLLLTLSLLICTSGIKNVDSVPKLTDDDLKFLFGDKDVPDHSVIHITSHSREKRHSRTFTEDPGRLDVTLEDKDGNLTFEMHHNYQLVSPDFLLVVRDENGIDEHRLTSPSSCVFVGTVKGDPNTRAALSNCDGTGYTGVITSSEGSHLIRPLNQRKKRQKRQTGNVDEDIMTPDGLHIIHARNKKSKCAMFNTKAMTAPRYIIKLDEIYNNTSDSQLSSDAPYEESAHGPRFKRQLQDSYRIETAVFVDDEMYKVIRSQNPGSDIQQTIQDVVFAIMNGVHLLYNAPSLSTVFTITLVRLDIIKSATQGPNKASGDIQRYLSSFCFWQKSLQQETKPWSKNGVWDHALLLSGLDLWDSDPSFDSVIGLAWVAGMCHPTYSCTINEGTSFEAVYVITHEMGHNLGMSHDGSAEDGNTCSSDEHIMSASTGPGKVTWSKCSNNELEDFLKRNDYPIECIEDRGERSIDPDLDLSTDELLPGEKYSVQKQCSYALGSTFKPYITSKYPYNDVCRETWCQNSTHAMRTHPGLEGTSCGVKKYCVNGECINKLTRPVKKTESTKKPVRDNSRTTTTTTAKPNRKSRGFSINDLFTRIRDMFKSYLFLSRDIHSLETLNRNADWHITRTSECTADCGGGWRQTQVDCAADSNYCEPHLRPVSMEACNTNPCI